MAEGLERHRGGAVLTVVINRPETRNALKMQDLSALHEILDEVDADRSIRALILTGAGERAFSAGVDLSDVGGDAGAWEENPLRILCDRLEATPRVTIARVNGAVIGGAAELTFACDFRVGVHGAKLMVPAARIGLHYEPAGLRRAVGVVGLQAARRIYLLAETCDTAALDRCGYFDRLVARDELDAATAALAAAAAEGAPLAVDGVKRTLVEIARGDLDAMAARARIRESWASADMREGLAAIREGRKPAFKGE